MESIAYRKGFLIFLFSEIILVWAFFFLWQAVFDASTNETISGMTFDSFFAYLLAARLTARFISGPDWGFFYKGVRSGEIICDLSQPLNLELALFFRWLGRKLVELTFTIPVYGLIGLLTGVWLHTNLQIGHFAVSLLLAFPCAFFFEMLVSYTAFFTTSQQGIHEAKALAVTLFSGALFPLTVLPNPLPLIFLYLPFASFVFLPVQILVSVTPEEQFLTSLAVQFGWTILFGFTAVLGMRLVRSRFNLQGG